MIIYWLGRTTVGWPGYFNKGISADQVSIQLGVGRGVCFKLKNRTHLFFKAFPELK